MRNLLRFRFCTSKQLALLLNRTNPKSIQGKLKLLEEQDFIGKRYDSSYKLLGRPAEYFLRPKGARVLESDSPGIVHPKAAKALYKNNSIQQGFLQHCLSVTDTAIALRNLYMPHCADFNILGLQVSHEYEDTFSSWRPDLFMEYNFGDGARCAFIDVWDENKPFFLSVKKMLHYVDFFIDKPWEYNWAPEPAILSVFSTPYNRKRLLSKTKTALERYYWDDDDTPATPHAMTTVAELTSARYHTDTPWLRVTLNGRPTRTTLPKMFSESS